MKILIFTEGTILMHKNAVGHSREEIVKQVEVHEGSVHNYASYVPIGNAVKKLAAWKNQRAEMWYLTSRKNSNEINDIKNILKKYSFPEGQFRFRRENEEYKDVVEKIIPDILIEDDCESIGGEKEMSITNVNPMIRKKIKSIIVKEFEGIDHLPEMIDAL